MPHPQSAAPSASMVVPRRPRADDLGSVVATARSLRGPGLVIFALGVFVAVVWVALVTGTLAALAGEIRASLVIAIVGFESLMLVPLTIASTRYGWQRRLFGIAVHERGVTVRGRAGPVTLAYDDVANVYESLEEVDTPIGKRLEGRFVLESRDGRRIVVDHLLPRHMELGALAAATAQEHLLAAYERALASSERATFGPLVLDTWGLQTPDASLAWNAIAFVRWERVLYRGSYAIHLVGGAIGARIPSEHVPNPRVLLALFERFGKLDRPKETIVAEVLGVVRAA